jgi:hypothetical protein
MSLSFGLFENALLRFMDDIATTKSAWSKPQLMEKWNELMGEPVVKKSDDSKKAVEKPTEKKPDSDRCIFKITRGDKMGEQCTSRSKKDESYCVKHFKPNRETKETKETEDTPSKEKQVIVEETKSDLPSSVRIEQDMKKKQETVEYEVVNGHTLVKGTTVVVNAKKAIIGYLDGSTVVHKQNKETEAVQKQYHLSFSPSKKAVDE